MANLTTETVAFSLPDISEGKINSAAVAKVNEFLPELDKQTLAFDRSNSQHTLSLMTLTMLNGQSPHRMLRQVLAEVENRKKALAEAQVTHAKTLQEINTLEGDPDPVSQAKLRQAYVSLDMLESKINGSFKDIATLIDAYQNIKEKNSIDTWDEESYEREEKRHHVRRGFELLYRTMLEGGRASQSSIEYLQQYGVHPQVAMLEVGGYLQHTAERISKRDLIHANDLEDFLDEMSKKYLGNVDATAERIFGKSEFTNTEYMMKLGRSEVNDS